MKQTRRIFVMFVALLLVGVLALSVACKPEDNTPTRTLQSISVDTSNAKTEFFAGEDFSANGLVVTARYKKSDSAATEEETVAATDYTVDSSKYNKAVAGSYTITVSYTSDDVTRKANYTVAVKAIEYDGLSVALAEGVTGVYHLTQDAPTAEIDLSKIVVKEADINGFIIDQPISGYTVELWNGKQQIEVSNGKANVGVGSYQIWVSKASDKIEGYVRKAFVIVYVVDDVVSLEWNSQAPGTLTTQNTGKDKISETWKFVATYESGATKPVAAKDVTFSSAIDTSKEGQFSVTATYTETNSIGEEITTTEATVTYTVTKAQGSGEGVTNKYNYSYSELKAAMAEALGSEPADKAELAPEYFTGANSFLSLTVGDKNDMYRTSGGGCIEIKIGKLSVTFEGTGTLTVAVASTGGSNKSTIGLTNASGQFVAATYTATNIEEGVDSEAGGYVVTGTSYAVLTFEITEPGTYSLSSIVTVNNRGTRIQSIAMVDNIGGGGAGPNTPDVSGTDVIYGTTETLTSDLVNNTALADHVLWKETAGATITILKDSKVKTTSQSVTVDGAALDITLGVNTAGAVTTSKKAIQLELRADAKVTVYYMAAGTGDRHLVISNGSANVYEAENYVDTQTVTSDSTTLSAGMYYIGANTGGMVVVCIVIEYV